MNLSDNPTYAPTSRRPIADRFRRSAGGAVTLCVRLGVHPDFISYLSIVSAAAAGIAFYFSLARPWLLSIAIIGCMLRLWLNMLDGMVALASGQASWRGEILNDLPDRLSDVLIFAGVAHSGWCNPFLGYWCAIAALLTAYVGMFGQAVRVQREFSGIMSKPWRMVTISLAGAVTFALMRVSHSATILNRSIFDWACIVILIGCVQTIAIRLKRIFAALQNRAVENK